MILFITFDEYQCHNELIWFAIVYDDGITLMQTTSHENGERLLIWKEIWREDLVINFRGVDNLDTVGFQ